MDHRYLVRDIILKYHRGEPLTAEEQAILDAEMAGLPEDKVWERVRSHIEARRKVVVMRPWYMRRSVVAVSAAAVLVVVAGGLYRYFRPAVADPKSLATVQRVWKTVAPGHYYGEVVGPDGVEVVDSASGGQSVPYVVTLPDGSKVTLSYASSVRYLRDFSERSVALAGQAHFDVAKDGRAFLVELGKTTISVLGTHFNVMHYPGVPDEITLLDGKVKLARGKFERELMPSERAVIHEGNPVRVGVRKLERPEEMVAWMGPRRAIYFDSTELSEVVQRMAQYYNKDIYIDPKFREGKPVTGIIELDRTLGENLEPIAEMAKGYDAHVGEKAGVIEVTN